MFGFYVNFNMAWWNINRTLTHNCLFNLIVGNRGSGKTYGCKKRAIKQFLDKGYEFIYLRRYQEELDSVKDSVFNDIIANEEFPEHIIEYKNGCYYVDEKLCGYAMALSKAKDYKSISYPKVQLIIFDEFLIEDNGYAHYLKNEVKQFLNFYMSIDRYRGVTAFLLANNVTMVNPYTVYWNLSEPYNSNYFKKGEILLEMVNDADFINEKLNTRFGKLIANTDFADYAIHNKPMKDRKDFIEKKTGNPRYYFTIKYQGECYGIWLSYQMGKIWVSDDVDPTCKFIYSMTLDDHTTNTLLIKSINKSVYFKTFIDAYKNGNVYFENQKVKNIIYEVIKMVIY